MNDSANAELNAAGPGGLTPTQPNPYKEPGGAGADAALSPDSIVEVRPPYTQAELQAAAYVIYGSGNAPKAAPQRMTSQEHRDRLQQAKPTPRAPRGTYTHAGQPLRHPTAAGTVGSVPLRKNPRKK